MQYDWSCHIQDDYYVYHGCHVYHMAEIARFTQSLLQGEVLLTPTKTLVAANIVYNFSNNVRNSLEKVDQGFNF